MDIKQIKLKAKENYMLYQTDLVMICLLYNGIYILFSGFIYLLSVIFNADMVNTLESLIVFVVGPIITFGVYRVHERVNNKFKPRVKDLFSQFPRILDAVSLKIVENIFVYLWTLLLIVPGFIKSFAYSQALRIKYENPELSATTCLKRSQNMMKGHKMQLFLLVLSYFWEYLLVLITVGIYSFWLTPKIDQALTVFYYQLKDNEVIMNQTNE